MTKHVGPDTEGVNRLALAGIGAVSAALLMTELALTRIFSVTMYYHFAFLAISIALFGLSASGVLVYVLRRRLARRRHATLLTAGALAAQRGDARSRWPASCASASGSTTRPQNLSLMLAIYVLAALPFLTGGAVISLAFARLADRINVLYAADLLGAALGCLLLIPLLNRLGAPGVVMTAATLSLIAALCFARARRHGGGSASRRCVMLAVPDGCPARRACAVRRRRHQRARRRPRALQQVELVLARRGVRPPAWRLVAEPDVHGTAHRVAVHGHRLGGVDADPEGHRQPCGCAIPALRADGARLSPRRTAGRLLGAGHRPGRRPRPALGAGLRRHSRGRRRDQPDHRARRHAATGSAPTRAASISTRASRSTSTTAAASCAGARRATT